MALVAVARRSLLAFALAVSASVAGCSAGPGEPVGETSQAAGFANDKAAFDYFLGKGLANFQAAGVVGNLDQESGVDPLAVQSGGPGRGIAQWSVGGRWDTDANDNATWYASQQGQSVDSLQLQLDFIWYELTTFSGYGLAALKASTDVTGATIAFQNDFEGCGTCNQSQRIAYAQSVLSLYGNDPADGGGSSADAGATGPSCTVPGVGTGVCILTSQCAAMPGYVSTPGYCPGPANEECCTGPAGDAGTATDAAGKADGADSGGASPGSSSGSASGSSGSGGQDASTVPGDWTTPSGSKGCSTSPGGAGGSSAAVGLVALVWLARRRRRAVLLGLALALAGGCASSSRDQQGYPGNDGGASSSGGSGSGSGSGGNVLGDGGGSSSGGGAGCAQAAEFVYVVDVNGALYQFNPPTLAFTQVGQVTCAGSAFFSMAVDRNAVAWVLAQDGTIVTYDINAKTCAKTAYVAAQQGFQTFGMGFSANGVGATTDTLFVTDDELQLPSSNRGLARIDTSSLALSPVAQYDQLKGLEAELTGTGDGRLFGAFEGSPYTIAEIDKTTAHIISVAPQNGINYAPSSSSLAFAFWGGDFWLFIGPGGTTDVFQYQPSSHATTKRQTEPFEIVGAGVSTCAPTTPPQ